MHNACISVFIKNKLCVDSTECSVVIIFSINVGHLFQVFFVIRLRPQANHELPPIVDPDPHISNELMDGRDSFLTMAREKHFEFSSLRRAKLSTMALLYELHNQGRDSFVYTCNSCKTHVETRYHCQVCDVSIVTYSTMLIVTHY